LLHKDSERIVILTAGHCVSFYLSGLQNGPLVDIGVSFDATIVRDLPVISQTAWSADQYILGGQPILSEDYGPPSGNAFNLQFDYGVIVFSVPEGGLTTQGGSPVDLDDIDPVTLPSPDFLVDKVNAKEPLTLTAVGYGLGEAHNEPGAGGNAGGALNDSSKLGVRWVAEHTAAFSFMGPEANLLLGSQNPARGNEGTCGGDSGGPVFFKDGNTEYQVGITSSGDSICRATSIIARTDAARAQAFLSCVTGSGGDPFSCGCAEVNEHGVCSTTR
jgi:hypothetical protein